MSRFAPTPPCAFKILSACLPAALTRFARDTSGAVTVDWVVLTAAVTGIGLGAAAAVRSGTSALGEDINVSLTNASVASMGGGGDSAWDAYPGQGITDGACPGPAALAATYETLRNSGTLTPWGQYGFSTDWEDSEYYDLLNGAETGGGYYGTNPGIALLEFGDSEYWVSNPNDPDHSRMQFERSLVACSVEALDTDWSAYSHWPGYSSLIL